MKNFFDKRVFTIGLLSACIGHVNAADFLLLNRDVTGDGNLDQVKLADNGSEFYTLSVISGGKELLRNENLVPRTLKNSGGLDIFQGLSVVDGNITIRYRFCSPSSSVCYFRNIISSFKDEKFVFSREETVASADKIALSGVFYKKPVSPLASLSYQSLLEDNDSATNMFSSTYGKCAVEMDGDSLVKISEELEKDSPNEWVLKKGCVTPALVFTLQAQKYLSPNAASRYFRISGADQIAK
ncbi:hypothetical protein QN414_13675 [Pseudomonas sp. 5S1]|nr:hypothetical protein [Pseudomonas sp. 5S1]MEB0225356.1 hypothetical protein [Pseudomonas sp. 5S1]